MKYRAASLILSLLLALEISGPLAIAQSLVQKGQWQFPVGNETADYVTVENSKGFLSTAEHLKIIDITNPKVPTLLSDLPLISSGFEVGNVGKATVRSNIVFVTAQNDSIARLFCIDFNEPTQPAVIGSLIFNDASETGPSHQMALDADILYIPLGSAGLAIVGVGNPSAPRPLATTPLAAGAAEVVVTNGLAYVAAGTNGFKIIDVTNADAPWLVGSIDSGETTEVALAGTVAYVLSSYNGGGVLRAIDVSNPVTPKITYTSPYVSSGAPGAYAAAQGLEIRNSTAFVGYNLGLNVRAFDLSNPAQPALLGALNIRGNDMDFAGNFYYSAEGNAGLVIYDIQDLTNPVRQSNFPTKSAFSGLAVSGGYAYIDDPFNGTHIIDVRDPIQPRRVASYASPAAPHGGYYGGPAAVAGNKAYISTGQGFDILDVSNPATPTLLGQLRTMSDMSPYVVSGNYAYASLYGAIIDVSDPANPHGVGNFAVPGRFPGLAIQGNFLYYALPSEIGVFDLTNPAVPEKRGTLQIEINGLSKMVPAGPILYLSDDFQFFAVNISNPDQLHLVTSNQQLASNPFAISGSNFFGITNQTLRLSDISDPFSPVLGPSIQLTQTGDIAADGAFAYILSANALTIYEGSVGPLPTRPTLEAINLGDKIALRWPKIFPDFQLYSMTALDQPRQLVTVNPASDGDYFVFTNTRPIGASLFYLLAK